MKLLERKGLVHLNPQFIDKRNGKLHEKGRHVACMPCQSFRPRVDGFINLRRNYCDYCFHQHAQNQGHITAKSLHDRKLQMDKKNNNKEKPKTLTQSMMSSFLVPKVRNATLTSTTANTVENNNESQTTNVVNNVNAKTSNEQNDVNVNLNESDKRYEIFCKVTRCLMLCFYFFLGKRNEIVLEL